MATKLKTLFSDCSCHSLSEPSSWNHEKVTNEVDCQTDSSLYETAETEVSTGLEADKMEAIVKAKRAGMTLFQYLCKYHKIMRKNVDCSETIWKDRILNKCVTVDCEVSTDLDLRLEEDFLLEALVVKDNVEVGDLPL